MLNVHNVFFWNVVVIIFLSTLIHGIKQGSKLTLMLGLFCGGSGIE